MLNTREVADILGVHPVTVTSWVNEGKLPAVVLPSGRHRFRRREIEALIGESLEAS